MINNTLRSISENWKLEAKLENSRYFFHSKETDDIIKNDKCYVIGRKGSGKSAICEHIVGRKEHDEFSSKLSFKNFPFNELYRLENQKYTPPNQYITLWKYLIYSHVCSLMTTNNNIDSNIRLELEKLYPKNSVKPLSRSISKWTNIGFGVNILSNGGTLNISRENVKNDTEWIEKVNILEDIILNYCDNSKYFIVFDELDEDYRDIRNSQSQEESNQYVFLLTSLFKAVQDIKAIFKDGSKNIMPIIFLRDDIYSLIKDSDKNKWRDFQIEIEWNKENLKKLLAFRISQDYNSAKEMLSFKDAWDKIFFREEISFGNKQVKKMNSFDFIAKSTQLRPRDFIQYIQECAKEAYERKDRFIREATIKYTDRAFSNYLRNEIIDEIFPILPEIEEYLQVLSNIRKWNFSISDFEAEYNKYLKYGTIKEKNIDFVLDNLYNFSVIGNQHKFKNNTFYFKYLQTNMKFNKTENIVIHRGLFKALSIQ